MSHATSLPALARNVTVPLLDPDDQPIMGWQAIGAALGGNLTRHQIFYGLKTGEIPASKYRRCWVTTRRRLRARFAGNS